MDVDVVARPSDGSGPQGHRVSLGPCSRQAIVIPPKRRDVREQKVRDQNGLGGSKVRERRHQGVGGGHSLACEGGDAGFHAPLQRLNAAAQVESQIDRDLLVARPAGVKATARVAQALDEQPLDETVDVLVRPVNEAGVGAPSLENVGENGFDLARLIGREHTGLCEHTRPRDAPRHVIFKKTPVEAKRGAKLERGDIGDGIEPAGPECSHQSSVVSHRSAGVNRQS